MTRFTYLALGICVLTAGCSESSSQKVVRVNAGGATFVDPIMRAWAKEYRKKTQAEIDYVKTGSGKGIGDLTAKTIDFGCSDAPMNRKELDAARASGGEVLHIPITMGAVAVVFNLPGIDSLQLTGEVLAEIYLNKVTKWNDPKIVALNPKPTLPDQAIIAVRRAESSGTTSIFSEYLSKVHPEFRQQVGVTKEMILNGGVGQQGNDGISGFVKNNPGSIGYVELAYANRNKIATAQLKNKAGSFVRPNPESVTSAAQAAMMTKPTQEPYTLHELTYSLTDADGAESYPIVGISYAILYAKLPNDKGPTIVNFLKWAIEDGQKYSTELDYAPLPLELVKKALVQLDRVSFE